MGKKKAKEDLLFLQSQRTDRVAKMGPHDKKYDTKKFKSMKRKGKEENYKNSEIKKGKHQFEVVTDTTVEEKENNNDEDFEITEEEKKDTRKEVTLSHWRFQETCSAAQS